MTYRNVRKAVQRTTLDRDTWAGPTLFIASYDTEGGGTFETELILFGTVFEDAPFFSYGVEAAPGQALVPGDFPFVSCGVSSWHTTEVPEGSQAKPFYLGAYLWISVQASTSYTLRFRLSFEGIAMRNVEYFSNG